MNHVDEAAGRLSACLGNLTQALMEMTAVFRVKRQVLAKADMQALSELFEREEAVAERLFSAESEREIIAEELAEACGARGGKLVDITDALEGDARQELLEQGTRLNTTMGALVREARIVALVCRAAVDHYDKLIRIITGASLEGGIYTSHGLRGDDPRRSIIDQAI